MTKLNLLCCSNGRVISVCTMRKTRRRLSKSYLQAIDKDCGNNAMNRQYFSMIKYTL